VEDLTEFDFRIGEATGEIEKASADGWVRFLLVFSWRSWRARIGCLDYPAAAEDNGQQKNQLFRG
jgi:hypothetical protein